MRLALSFDLRSGPLQSLYFLFIFQDSESSVSVELFIHSPQKGTYAAVYVGLPPELWSGDASGLERME